jgi:hypothetical protein
MPIYRVCFLEDGVQISRPAVVIDCVNDEVATQKARRLLDGNDIELWRGDHLVTLLAHR